MAKTRVSFFIDSDLQHGLRALKVRDGVAEAESIRRAIAAYLRDHGITKGTVKAARSKAR